MAFLLLVSNAGLAFNVHFCGGSISSISSVYNTPGAEKDCCGKSIVTSHKKCCTDKVVNLKGKTDYGVVKAFSFQADMLFVVHPVKPVVFSHNMVYKTCQVSTYYCDAHAPPLFKLYTQYIFYA